MFDQIYILKAKLDDDPHDFMISLCAFMTIPFMILFLCYFGQRITTKANLLHDATYNIKWYKQSKSFKQCLIIMRILTGKGAHIMAGMFPMTHESFYQISNIAYSNYNNLCGINRIQ